MQNTNPDNQRARLRRAGNGGRGPTQTIIRFLSRMNASLMLAAVACALPARSQMVTFDATTNSDDTVVESISPSGAVTGYYDVRVGPPTYFLNFAFLRTQNGQTISFGTPTTNDVDPQGIAINSAGEVTGNYYKDDGVIPGYGDYFFQSSFLRLVDGTVINIDPTNAYTSESFAINGQGTVVGIYGDASDGSSHFYLRDPKGVFTEFDLDDDVYPLEMGLNQEGAVAGCYYDGNGNAHSFVRTAQGAIASFDEPDAVTGTFTLAINQAGAVAGYYGDTNGVYHGYLLSPDGQFTTFDPQGSTDTYDTCINSGGAISGYYTDINGVYHGFVRASNGDITTIDPQGSTGTFPTYINPGGVVSGYYNDASYHSHGFVYQTNGH